MANLMVNFKLLFYNDEQQGFLLRITCLFWLFAKVMSWRIWNAGRLLPTVPVFEYLNYLPAFVHSILFVLSIVLILFLLVKSNRVLLTCLLGVEVFSCLLDQNRLLPWEYQYVFTIFIFIVNEKSPKLIPACIAVILVSTYFYSGLCKLNVGFLNTVWTKMILRSFLRLPEDIVAQNGVHYGGYLLGIIELLAGVGLLFVKTRIKAAKMLIVIHFVVLVLLGPFGFKGYRVLWPWNISMILFIYFIFLKGNEELDITGSVIRGWNSLVLICWGFLPIFSFFGYWDTNLSSNLFSANVPRLIICVGDTSKCKPLKRFCTRKDIPNTCHGLAKIDIQTWAFSETNVSAYPAIRTYQAIQAKLEKKYPAAGLSFVYVDR